MKTTRKYLPFVMALLGMGAGALLASARALTYGYYIPWAMMAVMALAGGYLGWRAGGYCCSKETR